MCIRMKNEAPFMLGGVYSIWKDEDGAEHPSFSIITTEPNELMASIHNRMPVIIPEERFAEWLDPAHNDIEALTSLLVPYPADAMKAFPVSRYVNNTRNEGEQCLEPAPEAAGESA